MKMVPTGWSEVAGERWFRGVREGGQSSSKEDSAGVCEGKSLLPFSFASVESLFWYLT